MVEEECRKNGFEFNIKKKEVMIFSRSSECSQINIFINGKKLKQRDQFKYLGTSISRDERKNTEVASRIE